MIVEKITAGIKEAMLARNDAKRGILKVALGDIQALQFSKGQKGEVTDEQAIKVIQKIIKGNEETLALSTPEKAKILSDENEVLKMLLPLAMSEADIRAELTQLTVQIKEAKSEGMAIGIASKLLKSTGKIVDNSIVSKVIKEIRINP